MESHEIVLVAAVLLLSGAAIFLALTEGEGQGPEPDTDIQGDDVARSLLLKGLSFGTGIGDYTYSYVEDSDG